MYELVGSVFNWRSVECMSWLVLILAGGRWVYELVGSIFSYRSLGCMSWLALILAGSQWGVRVGWF